jgi:hypothetical protein
MLYYACHRVSMDNLHLQSMAATLSTALIIARLLSRIYAAAYAMAQAHLSSSQHAQSVNKLDGPAEWSAYGGAICVPCTKMYPQQHHETKCTPKGIIKRNVPPNSIMKQYAQVRLCTCRVNNGSAQIPTAWKTSTCICTGASMQC